VQPNTLTRREYNAKIRLKILEKNNVRSETGSGPDADPKTTEHKDLNPDTDPKRIIPDPQHCEIGTGTYPAPP
jgi:hypothetical protein